MSKYFKAIGFIALLMSATAQAQQPQTEYLEGIERGAQDAMRAGLSNALRKLPPCNPYQMYNAKDKDGSEHVMCCAPGFVSLGKECARIAPQTCANVAIDAPESCNITRCAKYTHEIEKEVPAIGDDGKPIPGQMEKKKEDVPCEPWKPDGSRDLTCELDTYDCKKDELAGGGGGARWCGDWIKVLPAPPQVDAGGKPIAGSDRMIRRCKPTEADCILDSRECTGKELMANKSDGIVCPIGQYSDDQAKCQTYKCPALCTTADGRCAKCGPDYQGAAGEFKKATEVDKRFYEAYFNLGMSLERLGKYKEAVTAYEAAKAINPNDDREKSLQLSAQAYIARAMLAEAHRAAEAGEKAKAKSIRDQAKGVCDSILAVDPDNAMMNVTMGLYFLEEGDNESAEKFVRTALRTNREDTIALNIRGSINLKQNKNEIARWILEEKVLGIDPSNPEALANLGLAYVRLGDLPKAVAAFEKAVKLNPNSISARMNLGAIYLEYLNYRDADRQYNVALKLEPDNLEALTGAALSLEGKRDPKKAAEIYEKVLAKDGTRNAILVRLALIYDKAPFNDGTKAISYWKKYIAAINLPPPDPIKVEVDAARAKLKTFEKPPKKMPGDWSRQKAEAKSNEEKLTLAWKNSLAIYSRIDAIEKGMELEKQAKDPAPKPTEAPKPGDTPKPADAPK